MQPAHSGWVHKAAKSMVLASAEVQMGHPQLLQGLICYWPVKHGCNTTHALCVWCTPGIAGQLGDCA